MGWRSSTRLWETATSHAPKYAVMGQWPWRCCSTALFQHRSPAGGVNRQEPASTHLREGPRGEREGAGAQKHRQCDQAAASVGFPLQTQATEAGNSAVFGSGEVASAAWQTTAVTYRLTVAEEGLEAAGQLAVAVGLQIRPRALKNTAAVVQRKSRTYSSKPCQRAYAPAILETGRARSG